MPEGASGSSAINANLLAPGGMPLHFSGGEIFWPSQVYFAGIGLPSLKAELVNCICPRPVSRAARAWIGNAEIATYKIPAIPAANSSQGKSRNRSRRPVLRSKTAESGCEEADL